MKFSFVTILSLLISSLSYADVKLPAVFSSNMVLQREIQVPVWGWADPGEEVTVNFSGQSNTVKADADGKWMVKLSAMPAGGPFEMTVRGNNTVTFTNVMVGEVWICSGQSNMEFHLEDSRGAREEIKKATNSNIRLFQIPETISAKLKALGRRLATPGGFTDLAGSVVVIPSFTKNECNPRTAITVLAAEVGASAGCIGSPRRRATKKSETCSEVT